MWLRELRGTTTSERVTVRAFTLSSVLSISPSFHPSISPYFTHSFQISTYLSFLPFISPQSMISHFYLYFHSISIFPPFPLSTNPSFNIQSVIFQSLHFPTSPPCHLYSFLAFHPSILHLNTLPPLSPVRLFIPSSLHPLTSPFFP